MIFMYVCNKVRKDEMNVIKELKCGDYLTLTSRTTANHSFVQVNSLLNCINDSSEKYVMYVCYQGISHMYVCMKFAIMLKVHIEE